MSDNCPTCNAYLYSFEEHRCKPRWEVKDEDGYIDGIFFANDAEAAAEDAVSSSFWDDPCDDLPSDLAVTVTPIGIPDDRKPMRVAVSGEPDVAWSSHELPDEPEAEVSP